MIKMKQTVKIIYWYDPNVTMYTFQFLDKDGNQTEDCEYTSKWYLTAHKEALKQQYGIMPTKLPEDMPTPCIASFRIGMIQ